MSSSSSNRLWIFLLLVAIVGFALLAVNVLNAPTGPDNRYQPGPAAGHDDPGDPDDAANRGNTAGPGNRNMPGTGQDPTTDPDANANAGTNAGTNDGTDDPDPDPEPEVPTAQLVFMGRAINGVSGQPASGTLHIAVSEGSANKDTKALGTGSAKLRDGGYFRLPVDVPEEHAARETALRLHFRLPTGEAGTELEARATVVLDSSSYRLGNVILFAPAGIGTINGIVRDTKTDSAIEGATVTLHDHAQKDGWGSPVIVDMATTASDGRYSFDTRPSRYAVAAVAEGYGLATSPIQRVQNGETIEVNLELGAGITVTGTVTDAATEKPMADVTVGAVTIGETTIVVGSTQTAEDGTYTLLNLTAGQQLILAEAPGYANAAEFTALAPPGPVTVDLALAPGTVLHGRVEDSDGNPVTNYVVRAWAQAGDGDQPNVEAFGQMAAEGHAVQDDEGRFVIDDLEAGTFAVEVVDNRHARTIKRDVVLTEGGLDDELVIVVAAGGVLYGRVMEAGSDKPVEGARIAVARMLTIPQGEFPFVESSELFAVSGTNGAYRLEGVPAGQVHVWVTHSEYPQLKTQIAFTEGEEKQQDLELNASPARLSGIAMTLDGEPAAGRVVIVQNNTVGQVRTNSDSDGRFVFEQIEPGAYLLMLVSASGMSVVTSRNVVLQSGDDVTADLSFPPDAVLVEGTVTDGEGKPTPGVTVMFNSNDRPDADTVLTSTDTDGTYRARVLPGDYLIIVQRPGVFLFRESATIQPLDTFTLDFRVPVAELIGKLLDGSSGAPMKPGVELVLEPVDSDGDITSLGGLLRNYGGQMTTRNEDGTFNWTGISAGTYRLRAFSKGFGVVFVDDVQMPEEGSLNLGTLVFVSQSTLQLTVRDDTGAGVADAILTIVDGSGRNLTMIDSVRTDAEGNATVDFLQPGNRYTITASAAGFGPGSVQIETGATLDQQATITLEPGGTLVVLVRSALDDRPVVGARVELRDSEGRVIRPVYTQQLIYGNPNVTDAAGRVTRTSLTPGTYTVTVIADNNQQRTVDVTVSPSGLAGQPDLVTISLSD